MMNHKPQFLLVHGAWHGAWCFAPLIEALERRGVGAVAIDLPGHGDRLGEPATLASYANAVAEALAQFASPPLVVGHSLGGTVITAAAGLAASRMAGLVYLCAFLPADGESVALLGREAAKIDGAVVDPATGTMAMPAEAAMEFFYHDCARAEFWARQLRPQPMAPMLEAIAVTSAWGSVPRAYIVCTQDRVIPRELQARMADRAMPMPRFEMESGHSPFLAAPDLLADVLMEVRARMSCVP